MNDEKKIAVLVINCLQGGGAERSVLTLGKGFYEIGYNVHILRFKPLIEYDLNPDLNYHLLKFKPYKLIPNSNLRHKIFSKAVDKFIIENIGEPDIVISNLERADRVMSYSSLDNVVHVIRNDVRNDFDIPINATITHPKIKDLIKVYGNHPCVCVSKGVKSGLDELLGNKVKSTTIYNAFDIPLINQMALEKIDSRFFNNYAETNSETKSNKLKNIINSGEYVVHVGSFKPQKAHDILLKAYKNSQKIYPLLLVGKGKDLERIKQLAIELKLEDNVYFLGFHKNPYPFINNAKLFVLSSRFEGFVRVVAEALALGTPVISTDCPSGPSELLNSNHLVPINDIEALSEKMDEAMNEPSAFKATLDDKFLPKNVAKQYVKYLEH